MTIALSCPAHYWLLTPTWERRATDPPGYCQTCGAAMPEHKASNATRGRYAEAKATAQRNGGRGPAGVGYYWSESRQRWIVKFTPESGKGPRHFGTYRTEAEAKARYEEVKG